MQDREAADPGEPTQVEPEEQPKQEQEEAAEAAADDAAAPAGEPLRQLRRLFPLLQALLHQASAVARQPSARLSQPQVRRKPGATDLTCRIENSQ